MKGALTLKTAMAPAGRARLARLTGGRRLSGCPDLIKVFVTVSAIDSGSDEACWDTLSATMAGVR